MKIIFQETASSGEFELIPETPAEVATLFRFARNAAAKKPSIYLTFSSNEPSCYVSIEKRKRSVQVNSINNKLK